MRLPQTAGMAHHLTTFKSMSLERAPFQLLRHLFSASGKKAVEVLKRIQISKLKIIIFLSSSVS